LHQFHDGQRSHIARDQVIRYRALPCEGDGMELRDAVRGRRMIRTYDADRTIPRETVDSLLNLAIRAPSAGHTQGWRLLVLDDITSRDRFWAATSEDAPDEWLQRLQTAPVLVLFFSDKQAYLDRYAEPDKGWADRDEAHWPIPYWHVDTGMAAMIFLLAAQDAGLAACFFGVPGDRWAAVAHAFDVPAGLAPVGVVSLGHPAADRRSPSLRRSRRQLGDVVAYGSFAPSG
jgi:nitroreductase